MLSRTLRAIVILVALSGAPGFAIAQTAGSQCVTAAVVPPPAGGLSGFVNTLEQNVTATMGGMVANSESVGKDLFQMLFAAEIAWFLIETAWRKRHLADLVGSVGFRLLSTMTFATLLVTVGQSGVVTGLMNNFTQVGNYIGQGVNASALGGTSSTQITTSNGAGTLISTGVNMANCIITTPFHNFENESLGSKLSTVAGGLLTLAPGIGDLVMAATLIMLLLEAGLWLLTLTCYIVIVAQYLITLTEGALILSAGVFLLGFSAARWTMPFAQAYWRFAISIAMKLFACELVATVGAGLIGGQVSNVVVNSGISVQNILVPIPTLSIQEMGSLFIVCAFVLMLAVKIPGIAGSLITGSPSFSLATAVETGVMAGGIALAPLAAAGAAAGGAAGISAAGKASLQGLRSAAAAGKEASASISAGAKAADGGGSITSGARALAPPSDKTAAPSTNTPSPPAPKAPTSPLAAVAKAIRPLTSVAKHSAAGDAGTAGHDLGARHLDL